MVVWIERRKVRRVAEMLGGGGSWMFAKKKTEGRKEYCKAEAEALRMQSTYRLLSNINVTWLIISEACAVEWAEASTRAAAAQHRHPRRWEATVSRLCIVAVGLACLSLIVKFFAAHSGPFYRLILDQRESNEERNGNEERERDGLVWRRQWWWLVVVAVKVARIQKGRYYRLSTETWELRENTRAPWFLICWRAHSRGYLSNFYAIAHARLKIKGNGKQGPERDPKEARETRLWDVKWYEGTLVAQTATSTALDQVFIVCARNNISFASAKIICYICTIFIRSLAFSSDYAFWSSSPFKNEF